MQGLPIVLTTSRKSSSEEKGQHRVVHAFNQVLKKFPDAKYVMAGPGEDQRIDEAIESYPNIAESIIDFGYVSDKQRRELFNICDVFVLPSKNEGFAIVFIEALACGAKVIASDGYGCKEGLLNGELGRVINPDNINQLADVIVDELIKISTIEDRRRINKKTIEIYGYDAWCRKTVKFLSQIGSN